MDTAGISEFPSGMTTFIYHRVYLSQCGRYLDELTTHATADPSCQDVDVEPLMGQSRVCCSAVREKESVGSKARCCTLSASHYITVLLRAHSLHSINRTTQQKEQMQPLASEITRGLGGFFCTGPCAEIHTAVTVTDSPASRRSEVSGILYR